MPGLETDSHRGWQRLRLCSANMEITIFPELGGTISSLRRRPDNLELLYQPPWDLPPFGHPLPGGTPGMHRYDIDPGGWQTVFPNGGDATDVAGAEWLVDGEARITAFDVVDEGGASATTVGAADPAQSTSIRDISDAPDPPHDLVLRARLRRCPAELTKRIRLEGATVSVTETVHNRGASDLDVMWGHQLRFGPPLVGAGAEVDCPASFVHPDEMLLDDVDYEDISPWPRTPGETSMINLRYLPEAGAETRMAYLSGFSEGAATIRNSGVDCSVDLSWDAETWPHLWYGFEAGQDRGYPWYGNGYFLTLSPNSSWPAHGLDDARRVSGSTLRLDSDEFRSQTVTLTCDAPLSEAHS